ncbi:glycosyltransferase family 4 protein [uncultured Microbulbifer sp.]|uniref:glycosyltransferase family 4 protein n=1 Tax=uncultured Microbulbifer sp. TaxID=348147 RepID=UPI00260E116A|nr:glycosyltransferase family 4 protein [uncultured Microbulbifer sp.]
MDVLLKHAEKLADYPVNGVHTSIGKRIAYIVSHGQSYASNGYAVRTQGVAKALNEHGFDTLCFVRPGRPWELGVKKNPVKPEVAIDGVRYIHSRWSNDEIPSDERAHLEACVVRFIELFQIYRPAMVLAASDYIVGLPAWIAAKRLGLPFYNEVRGFWELSRSAREPGFENTPLFKIEAERDVFVSTQALKVFTLNQPMKAELIRRGVKADKIHIVSNGISDPPTIKSFDLALKRRLGINSDDKVVGYVGSFNSYEGLDTFIDACIELNKQGEKFKLLLVGDEQPVSKALSDQRVLAGRPWIIQVGRIPHEQVADYYALIDTIVIPRKKLPVCELVSPMKVVEAMAFGKRLVVSDLIPLTEITKKYQGVVIFEAGRRDSLVESIRQTLRDTVPSPKVLTMLEQTKVLSKVLRGENPKSEESIHGDSAVNVDELIFSANKILEQPITPINEPVRGRIALVVSHGQTCAQNGYAKRTHEVAKSLIASGFDTLCFVRGKQPREAISDCESVQQKIMLENIPYIQNLYSDRTTIEGTISRLASDVESYIEIFRAQRPAIVIAAGNFTTSLPAIVAARKLALPVIKEHLSYVDAFLDDEIPSYFSGMSFTEKFALEQACTKMADSSYYLYPEERDSWNSFLEIINRASKTALCRDPIVTLSSKAVYKIGQAIDSCGLYSLELDVDDETGGNPKGIVASFRFFDSEGKGLKDKRPNFASSKAYPHYQYVDTSKANGSDRVLVFSIQEGVCKVEVDIVAFATNGELKLRKANLNKVRVEDVARWLSLSVPGVQWIKAVEPHIHKEGATSLRLALLNYKYTLSKHSNDLSQLNGAIQEMVELDRYWVPNLVPNEKILKIKDTGKLTVAHLHKTAYPYENTGGAIRCLNTVLSQQRIKIDSYIITPIGYPRSAGISGAKNHEVIEGIEHFRIGANTDGLRGISLPDRTNYSAFHIAKILKSRGANVIHAASGVRGYELALQALALKRATGLPLLYEVRSFHEHTWTPVRSDVMELEKTKLRVIKEDFCMDEADLVTTISYSMKKILTERGIPPEKIEVIPNAIDEAKYLGIDFKSADIPELQGADYVVGYISNMSLREGHEYLIRAIHQLRNISGLDIRGLLVGNGPEHDNLQKLTSELGLEEVICFPGEVDHSQINSYYKAIDLFVIPRIPDYAADWVTPLKPYEAMALERPIIVTSLPALKEIVGQNEERGLVAKPADVGSLVDKLQDYIKNPAMRQNKVRVAKEWVFAERTWSSNAKRYDSIYRRLIALSKENSRATKNEKEALHA